MGILAATNTLAEEDTPAGVDNKPWEERPVLLGPLAHQKEGKTDPGAGTDPAQAAAQAPSSRAPEQRGRGE